MPARVLVILTATATLLFTASSGVTATLQWDADPHLFGAQGGSGNWLGSNMWWTGIRGTNTTWVSGSAASFGPSAGTVSVNGAVTADSLSFSTTGYTISGSSALTLSGANTITVTNASDTAESETPPATTQLPSASPRA
jgi:fibronectin-binding autotransporter adhesin